MEVEEDPLGRGGVISLIDRERKEAVGALIPCSAVFPFSSPQSKWKSGICTSNDSSSVVHRLSSTRPFSGELMMNWREAGALRAAMRIEVDEEEGNIDVAEVMSMTDINQLRNVYFALDRDIDPQVGSRAFFRRVNFCLFFLLFGHVTATWPSFSAVAEVEVSSSTPASAASSSNEL